MTSVDFAMAEISESHGQFCELLRADGLACCFGLAGEPCDFSLKHS